MWFQFNRKTSNSNLQIFLNLSIKIWIKRNIFNKKSENVTKKSIENIDNITAKTINYLEYTQYCNQLFIISWLFNVLVFSLFLWSIWNLKNIKNKSQNISALDDTSSTNIIHYFANGTSNTVKKLQSNWFHYIKSRPIQYIICNLFISKSFRFQMENAFPVPWLE